MADDGLRRTVAAAVAASPRVGHVEPVRSPSAAAVSLAAHPADAVVVHHDGGRPASLDRLVGRVGAQSPAVVLLVTDPAVTVPEGAAHVRVALPLSALDGHALVAAALVASTRPRAVPVPRPPARPARAPDPEEDRATPVAPEVLVLGASTGGPEAVARLLGALPAGLTVPVLLAQHIGADFAGLLVERLSAAGPLPVRQARHGEAVLPGSVVVAPGDHHMRVERGAERVRLVVDQGPRVHSCRPAVDPLMGSAAQVWGPAVLAVVLTGMGSDGLDGARAVRAAGGRVLVQDETTSVVWGMPGRVAAEGLADAVLPLDRLALRVAALLRGVRQAETRT